MQEEVGVQLQLVAGQLPEDLQLVLQCLELLLVVAFVLQEVLQQVAVQAALVAVLQGPHVEEEVVDLLEQAQQQQEQL